MIIVTIINNTLFLQSKSSPYNTQVPDPIYLALSSIVFPIAKEQGIDTVSRDARLCRWHRGSSHGKSIAGQFHRPGKILLSRGNLSLLAPPLRFPLSSAGIPV